MNKKTKQVSILLPTRKTKRMRARYNMLQAGMERINSTKGPVHKGAGRVPSKFALHWREWVDPSKEKTKRRAKA